VEFSEETTVTRILLTGGTGVLGRELRPRLLGAGYTVRVMSRRAPNPGEDEGVEWVQADLAGDAGLAEAVAGAEVVLHAGSSPFKRTRQIDLEGTGRLLNHARAAGVSHFIYISIVGIDQVPLAYYRHKLAAERLIEAAGVPWSILRATQFHYLLDGLIKTLTRLPVALVPTDFQFQVIDTGQAADQLVSAVRAGPAGSLPDIGGPEVLRLGEMTRTWLAAQGRRRPIIHLPLPGRLAAAYRQGLNTTPQNRAGTITWSEWLQTKYGPLPGLELSK
jgi:uncharacterized protein YbjT (DUF2867 family)